jgi:hypothetical protein
MNEASVKANGVFTLALKGKSGTTTPVPATVSYDAGTRTLTLNPNAAKLKKGTYTAMITAGAKDAAVPGNALAQNKTWTFRVARK